MVRPDVATRKVASATGRLQAVREHLAVSEQEFLADTERRDLATFYLFLAIQEIIDLAAHWVADSGWATAEDASSTFDALVAHGVSNRETAEFLKAAVGLRNRIAHGYAALDARRLYHEMREGCPHLERFLRDAADAAGI